MKKMIYIALLVLLVSCKKESVKLSTNANEIFWLSNAGADMPVWVRGNTASKVIILFLHGGPGDGSYSYTDAETNGLWKNYGVAYWDQRDAGSSAGSSNYADLNFSQMVDDLKKLVLVIRARYGNDMEIFLMGHSFGGLLGTAYLTGENNQQNIRGWIEVDGAHDYPQSYRLERQMLKDTGTAEIAKGNNVSQWTAIVNFCNTDAPNVSFGINRQLDAYGSAAETYLHLSVVNSPIGMFSPSSPFSFAVNYYKINSTAAGRAFLESLDKISYTNDLNKITIPALLLWGASDFTVPVGCAETAMNNLGSSYKRLVILPDCGHAPMNNNPVLFKSKVVEFIEAVK
jgi:pimeloyl-ACP methyl ester carboxylesterase